MFACHSCLEVHPTSTAHVDSNVDSNVESNARRPRVFCDAIWNTIQAEALVEAEREPLLRPLLERTVLQRDSIGDGLAMLLSQRLSDGPVESAQFYDEFRKVIAEDESIAASARCDLQATRSNDPAVTSLLHPFLYFKGILATQAYRIANAFWRTERRSLSYFLQSRVSEVFGVDIHPAAKIGSGVFIDHGTSVVIGETAVVGNNVTILHSVTLGGTGNEIGDRHPKVGHEVFIGAGAQLLGNIQIGDGSRIGASSVVLKDVDAYSTVAGVPARVVRRHAA